MKEEDLAYNVVLQRWLWRFIPSPFLNLLTFVMPKYLANMGHICIDATNIVGQMTVPPTLASQNPAHQAS